MPEPFHHDVGRNSRREQERGARVAEPVERDSLRAGCFGQARPTSAKFVSMSVGRRACTAWLHRDRG